MLHRCNLCDGEGRRAGVGATKRGKERVSRAKVLEFFAALPPCLVGIEACPTGHHWSRRLQALGHTVRLMPPSYVKAYLKRSKNDANDTAAIIRLSMQFYPEKMMPLRIHEAHERLDPPLIDICAPPGRRKYSFLKELADSSGSGGSRKKITACAWA